MVCVYCCNYENRKCVDRNVTRSMFSDIAYTVPLFITWERPLLRPQYLSKEARMQSASWCWALIWGDSTYMSQKLLKVHEQIVGLGELIVPAQSLCRVH